MTTLADLRESLLDPLQTVADLLDLTQDTDELVADLIKPILGDAPIEHIVDLIDAVDELDPEETKLLIVSTLVAFAAALDRLDEIAETLGALNKKLI